MGVNAILLALSASVVIVLGNKQVLTSTSTVTKTHTTTVTTHTLVPTSSGWLPAKLTKNEHPDAEAPQPAAKQPKALKKPVAKGLESRTTTLSTSVSKSPVTTVTKWATTTATVTTTYSSYAACKSTSNYVHGGSADGTSGVDGSCNCEAFVTTYAVSASSATQCCHICWNNPTCIGSAYTANDPYNQGCLYYVAEQCGKPQTYNYIEYFNGTKYGTNQTMSNGPCGGCVYVDA